MKKSKAIYYLWGDPTMPAHRIGSPKKDEYGTTPWLFIDGKWKGETVYVEPYKMRRKPLAPGELTFPQRVMAAIVGAELDSFEV